LLIVCVESNRRSQKGQGKSGVRYTAETPPPDPLPEAERGRRMLAPPPRFGEGVGGGGCLQSRPPAFGLPFAIRRLYTHDARRHCVRGGQSCRVPHGSSAMPIRFRCPECQAPVAVNDALAGLHTRCPSCSANIAVPDSAAPIPGVQVPQPHIAPP